MTKFAEKVVLFCHLTTQIPGEPHGNLLEEKGGQGFPHIVVMDAAGNVLVEHSGARTVAGFEKTVEKAEGIVKELAELAKQAAAGDAGAKIDLLIRQCELHHLTAAEAKTRLAELKEIPKEKQARIDAWLVNQEVQEIGSGLDGRDAAAVEKAAKAFVALKAAGRIPTDERLLQMFWGVMMQDAEKRKDAAQFAEAVAAIKAKFGAKLRKGWLDQQEAKLKAMQEGK